MIGWLPRCVARALRRDKDSALLVVVPTQGRPRLVDSARHILDAVRVQAQGYAGRPVRVVAVDRAARQMWCPETGQPVPSAIPRDRPTLLMNAAFLLADPPPIAELLKRVPRDGIAWCGSASTGDLYAAALRSDMGRGAQRMALELLTAGHEDPPGTHASAVLQGPLVAPAAASSEIGRAHV